MRRSVLGASALRKAASVGAAALLALAAALMTVQPATAAAPHADPRPHGRFLLPLSVDPQNPAAQQLALQRSTADRATLAAIGTIARMPNANWYGGPSQDVTALVRDRVNAAAAAHSVAQLVVFDLPNRGCGGAVEPGPTTAAGYRAWFMRFLAGLGDRRAIVIVEPDALGLASCLTRAQQTERYALIRWVVALLHRQGSWAYIDAGHSGWLSVDTAVARLRDSGIDQAAGFSLNESNFRPDGELIAYGTAISRRVGGSHFVIDSSRNGRAPRSNTWCNAPGTGLGHAPTEHTGIPLLDAFLWIKNPGGSDGQCNGGPSAGAWFQSYALSLVANARLG